MYSVVLSKYMSSGKTKDEKQKESKEFRPLYKLLVIFIILRAFAFWKSWTNEVNL